LERELFPEINSPSPDFQIPNGIHRFLQYWLFGASYIHVVADSDGPVTAIEEPKHLLLFNLSQRFEVGGEWYTVWFPPDAFIQRAGLGAKSRDGVWYCNDKRVFKKGEDIVKMRVVEGDHLFVDRVTYNFRHPERGEIIVFKTTGINYHGRSGDVPTDEFYIKRLVALGGEHVQIGDDHHLIIDGKRLDSSTPHFENLYNFRPDAGENEYFGHVQEPGSLLDSSEAEYTVPTNCIMVMGDNTRNSLDSRFFGGFDEKYVIGKASFVYWPISSRFGFGYR
jgi:signal peptidase I